MWNGELGTDEIFYHRNLKEIIPHLKSLSSKKYSEYVKTFYKGAYYEPEIDEDVHTIMSNLVQSIDEQLQVVKLYELPEAAVYKPKEIDEDKEFDEEKKEYAIYNPGGGNSPRFWSSELTDYGLFEQKVNLGYRELSKAGFVRYGRESNKEEMIFFLISTLMSKYPEIKPKILGGFYRDDLIKSLKGYERFYKKYGKPNPVSFSEEENPVSDKHEYGILISDKFLPNLAASLIPRFSDNLADIKCPYCGGSLNEVAISMEILFPAIWRLKGEALHKKMIEHAEEAKKAGRKIRPYKRTTLISMFYCARSLENEVGMTFFRDNRELQKIWDIPRMTWTDKWTLLTSLDENL
jgi:hypothetical protein